MMSLVIRQETEVFLLAAVHGACLSVLYDLLRALRRTICHGNLILAAEDFLFWLTAACLTFCFAFWKTDGIIRGYMAAGIILGVILYQMMVSRFVVHGCGRLFGSVKILLGFIWKILSVPTEKLWRKWKKSVVFARKKSYNRRTRKQRTRKRG